MKIRLILTTVLGAGLSLLLVGLAGAQRATLPQVSIPGRGNLGTILFPEKNVEPGSLNDDPPLPISIASPPYKQYQQVMASDMAGGAYVAWSDGRRADGKTSLYAQRLLDTGSTDWTNNGIPLTNPNLPTPPWEGSPVIISDGAGGSLLRWSNNLGAILLQRLDRDGNRLLDLDGKAVLTIWEDFNHDYALMAGDDAGGAYLVFGGPVYYDLHALRIDGMGNWLWGETVPLFTTTTSNFHLDPVVVPDGEGGLITVWRDYRYDTSGDVFAQRIDSSGNLLWDEDGLPVYVDTEDSFYQQNLAAVGDGDGGVFIVWEDERPTRSIPLGFYFATNIFAQHITNAGELSWSPEGLRLSDIDLTPCDWGGGDVCPTWQPQGGALNPAIMRDNADGVYVAWKRYNHHPSYYDSSSVRMQRVNLAGTILWTGISTEGVDITSAMFNGADYPSLISDGAGGAFIAYLGDDAGLTRLNDVIIQRINSNGTLLCGPAGGNISDLPYNDQDLALVEGSAGQVIVSWINWENSNWSDIFAQMVDGNCNGQWVGLAEVMIRDNRDDDGDTPSPQPWYESPDIWVRNTADGIEQHQNALAGQENTVYVRALNIGSTPVSDVGVNLYWAEPGLGMLYPDHWTLVGSTTISAISQKSSSTVAIPWTPPRSGHFCLFVRLVTPDDPILNEGNVPGENNIAQKNVAILNLGSGLRPSHSESVGDYDSEYATFEVVNLEEYPVLADVILERDQLASSGMLYLDLGEDLFQRWISETGGTLAGAEVVSDTTLIEVTSLISGTILGLPLDAFERIPVTTTVTGPPTDQNWLYIDIWERVDGETLGGVVLQAPYVFSLTGSSKTPSEEVVPPGWQVTYVVSLVNQGNHDIFNAYLEDILPEELAYQQGSLAWSEGEGQFFFDRVLWNGPVSLSEPAVISYTVKLDRFLAPGTLVTNTVVVDDGINPPYEVEVVVEVGEAYLVYLPIALRASEE